MPSDRDPDRITVRLAGREHRDWTTYQVESDLLTPADAWRVTLGIPADRVPAYVKPWATMELLLGDDLVLTGRIDRIERFVAKGEATLTLGGRDNAAVLVDCSAPIRTRREVDLAEAVDLLVKPLGLTKVRVDATGHKKKVEVEPGMTAWDALKRLCEANGCWAWCEPDGTLVVGGPDYAAPPVAELVLRLDGLGNNVKSVSVVDDVSGRHSEVTVLGQTHGTESASGQHNLLAVERDAGVTGYLELNRMWLDDVCPRNTESQAISYAVKYIRRACPTVAWIQSFADERCGGLGVVYQASNFVYCGSHLTTFWHLDGDWYHKLMLTAHREKGRGKYLQANLTRATRHQFRQFRYVLFLKPSWRKRLRLAVQAYPKRPAP